MIYFFPFSSGTLGSSVIGRHSAVD